MSKITEPKSKFEQELIALLNRHSLENESNTPDYLLAQFILFTLDALNYIINARKVGYKIRRLPEPIKGDEPVNLEEEHLGYPDERLTFRRPKDD